MIILIIIAGVGGEEEEGKIIKVNNGKSYVAYSQKDKKNSGNVVQSKEIKATKTEEKVAVISGKSSSSLKIHIDKAKTQIKKN